MLGLDKDLHVQIPEELHRWLRLRAAERHVKMRVIVEEALRYYRDRFDRLGEREENGTEVDKP